MTLTCEDANSKLVEVVTVADVDAGKRVDDSLEQILKLNFGQYFAADVWLRLPSWSIFCSLVWSRF